MQSLPYEILRRPDGRCALSVDAGLIPFVPTQATVRPSDENGGWDLLIATDDEQPNAGSLFCFRSIPDDVRERAAGDGCVLLFEFSRHAPFAAHRLVLASEAARS